MNAVREFPRRHPISSQEYLRMAEAGVFDPEARLELIEGDIVEMAPIGPPHAGTVTRLTRLLVRLVEDRAIVSIQSPVIVSDRSVPQPDLAVLVARPDDYSKAHPQTADILLAIEVSDTTLAFDKGLKADVYARAGIRELWVLDVNRREVVVHRQPERDGYLRILTLSGEASVSPIALPSVSLTVDELFPK